MNELFGGAKMKLKKCIAIALCASVVLSNITVLNAGNSGSYTGISDAQVVLNNIKFSDISSMPSTYWAKDAINKMSALSIIKGYGEKIFTPSNSVTKAEALALIYRALGREANAQKAGQAIEAQRSNFQKKGNALSIWSDGYLSLAKNDGIITQDQFDQAVGNTPAFGALSFNPSSPVQRQEMAQWIAMAFKITPINNESKVFNYSDWKQIDQDKVPYVEAIVNSSIMNGDNGYFYPKGELKRDEVAQVLSNMDDIIYKSNSLNKKYGYIENITTEAINEPGKDSTIKTILIRGNDGSLQKIELTEYSGSKNTEIGSHNGVNDQNEVVVSKNGRLGDSSLLTKDDEVQFIYDTDSKVKFIQAKTKDNNLNTLYGTVSSVDVAGNKISFTDNKENIQTLPVSSDAIILMQNDTKTLNDVPLGAKGYITVNHNVVTKIDLSEPKDPADVSGIMSDSSGASGIVQDINPNLNYITLYDAHGKKDLNLTRTYNFTPNIDIKKNGIKIDAGNIEVGDAAYIKFANNNDVQSINVESNYISKFGELLLNGKGNLTIRYDDGTIQKIDLDKNALVVKNGIITPVDSMISGDRLKITLNQNDSYTKIEGLIIEDDKNLITNIYKGKVYEFGDGSIELTDTKVLSRGNWVDKNDRGLTTFKLDDSPKIYLDNKNLSSDDAQNLLPNKNVYLAVYQNLSGDERTVMISASDGFEKTYNDEILNKSDSSKNFEMASTVDNVGFAEGTIVTRYGRLTTGNNLKINDPVYVVALKDPVTDNITAGVVQVIGKPSIAGIDIYRGRISAVDEGKSFTVDSFTILSGTDWNFVNTPKTFDITNDTRILSTQGLINNRDFNDYTTSGYLGKIVYIAAKGTQALTISDAQYGVVNVKGDVYDVSLPTTGTGATVKMRNTVVLNTTTGNWDSLGDTIINVPVNTIIIKNKNTADSSDLTVGDKIRIIKKDNTASGDGYIILVEG